MSNDNENGDKWTEKPEGIAWIHEAIHRLTDEWECIGEHFSALYDEDTTEEDIREHSYKLMKHLPAFAQHVGELSAEVFHHLCPIDVQRQLAKDMVEEMTGQPWEVVYADGVGFLLHQEDVKVPDEVPDEWTEGTGNGEDQP